MICKYLRLFLIIFIPAYFIAGCAKEKPEEENNNNKHIQYVYYKKGVASYYGKGFHGKKTASGEIFNQNAMTAAHKKLPFGTRVKVTNMVNNKSAIIKINDRGPFIKGREIDLSEGAAKKLDCIKSGICKIKIEIIK